MAVGRWEIVLRRSCTIAVGRQDVDAGPRLVGVVVTGWAIGIPER